ncbi:MAG: hypothetical protein RIB60_08810 [Phycisphaerales bacterium]
MTPRLALAAMSALVALADPAAASDRIVTRSRAEPITGSIVTSDAQFVTVELPSPEDQAAETIRIAWTDVRALAPAPDPGSELARQFQAGEDIWRAHERLRRRDATGALRLLEPHADDLLGLPGPVSAQLAEGLLAGALWVGDWPTATTAWLALDAEGTGALDIGWVGIDPDSGVALALPPAFVDEDAARFFTERAAVLAPRLTTQPRASALLGLYLDAAAIEFATREELARIAERHDAIRMELLRAIGRDEWVLFVADTVTARVGRPEARAGARERLRSGRRGVAAWADAWAGLAIGLSLVAEQDETAQRRGIVSLIDTALHAASTNPALAARAWSAAARAARSIGDADAARTFEAELNARYPDFQPAPSRGPAPAFEEGLDS